MSGWMDEWMDLVKAVVRSWGFYPLDTGDETFFLSLCFICFIIIF